LVERHEHPVWGGALVVRSLKKAIGEGEAKRWINQVIAPQPSTANRQPRPAHYQPLQDTRFAEVQAMSSQDLRQLRAEMTGARELPKLKEHFRKHGSEFEDMGITSPEALNVLFRQHIQRMDLRIFTYVSTQPATQYRQWVLVGMDNGVIVVYNESKRRHWSMMRARSITEYLSHQRGWWVEVSDWDDKPKIERQ